VIIGALGLAQNASRYALDHLSKALACNALGTAAMIVTLLATTITPPMCGGPQELKWRGLLGVPILAVVMYSLTASHLASFQIPVLWEHYLLLECSDE